MVNNNKSSPNLTINRWYKPYKPFPNGWFMALFYRHEKSKSPSNRQCQAAPPGSTGTSPRPSQPRSSCRLPRFSRPFSRSPWRDTWAAEITLIQDAGAAKKEGEKETCQFELGILAPQIHKTSVVSNLPFASFSYLWCPKLADFSRISQPAMFEYWRA